MKATNSSPISLIAVRALELVGIIMIVSYVLDLITLLIPPNLMNVQWRLNFTSQAIDRGVIPMVGVVFILVGVWLYETVTDSSGSSKQNLLKGLSIIFALIVGVFYLGVTPLHAMDTINDRNATMTRIEGEAKRAEDQLQNQLNNPQFQAALEQQQKAFKTQVTDLLGNQQQLEELQKSGQLGQQQVNLLNEFKKDPGSIDQFIETQTQELPKRALTRIREGKKEAEQQAQVRSMKSISRGISSLLLAVGFLGIGLSAFSGGGKRSRRRKAAGV